MTASQISLKLLLSAAFLGALVSSEMAWVFFWPKEPLNNLFYDPVPDGQPNTNAKFEEMLGADGQSVSWSRTESMGDQGSTWWWLAHIERQVVKEKYEGLEMVSTISLSTRRTVDL